MSDMIGKGRLTFRTGTAMYVGAVLGTGVIALPALAADAAGPASLLAWLALVVLSAPLAGTFAALGSRYPDSGGVSTYARLAFGPRAAAVVGWCFYFAVPPGATAAALFGGAYVSSALGGGKTTTAVTALVLMVVVTVANAMGLRVSSKFQFALAGLLVTLLLVSVGLSLPHAQMSNLTPFAPNGWTAIASAAALLVWSFAGWEAITHLAAEFRRPDRDLPKATAAAVAIIGVLYLLVAFATITVLGSVAVETDAPLGELMAVGLGGSARWLAAGAAVLLTLGAMNAYYAGAAKLGAALGRDGALPAVLSHGSMAGDVPRRSLAVNSAMSFAALAIVVAADLGTRPLVLLTTGSFVTVYVIGVAAAIKLLPQRTKGRAMAMASLVAVIALLLMSGPYLIWPVAVTGAALLYLRLNRHRRPAPADQVAADQVAAEQVPAAQGADGAADGAAGPSPTSTPTSAPTSASSGSAAAGAD